jgi:hypothetical protein
VPETGGIALQFDENSAGGVSDFATSAYFNADAGVKILYDEDLAVTTVHHTP